MSITRPPLSPGLFGIALRGRRSQQTGLLQTSAIARRDGGNRYCRCFSDNIPRYLENSRPLRSTRLFSLQTFEAGACQIPTEEWKTSPRTRRQWRTRAATECILDGVPCFRCFTDNHRKNNRRRNAFEIGKCRKTPNAVTCVTGDYACDFEYSLTSTESGKRATRTGANTH